MTEVVLNGKKIIFPNIKKEEITVDSINYNDELLDTLEFKPEEIFEKKYEKYSLEDTLEFKDNITENEK